MKSARGPAFIIHPRRLNTTSPQLIFQTRRKVQRSINAQTPYFFQRSGSKLFKLSKTFAKLSCILLSKIRQTEDGSLNLSIEGMKFRLYYSSKDFANHGANSWIKHKG